MIFTRKTISRQLLNKSTDNTKATPSISNRGKFIQETVACIQCTQNTHILVITGAATLAHFKNLPTCPKIQKLVLKLTPEAQSDITQETPLNIAKTFPNLAEITSQDLSPASGKIISEMLATETLQSLILQNISKQEDTLSGPLHHITFWNNAMLESSIQLRGGELHKQVKNSLTQLGRHKARLDQLDLKVSDLVDEQAVIEASKSLKAGGTLTLGQSKQVTEDTVTKIKTDRPDLRVTFEKD